jgi:hypothetical protein
VPHLYIFSLLPKFHPNQPSSRLSITGPVADGLHPHSITKKGEVDTRSIQVWVMFNYDFAPVFFFLYA